MKFDDHGYVTRLFTVVLVGFAGCIIAFAGLAMVDVTALVKMKAINERLDKIEAVLEADAVVGAAQVRFNRAVTEELEGQDPDLRVIEEELNLDKLAAEYVEVINAQPLH